MTRWTTLLLLAGSAHAAEPADAAPDPADVHVVVYMDYLCSHCERAWHESVPKLRERGVDVELRLFPLASDCNPAMPPGYDKPVNCMLSRAAMCVDGKLDTYSDFVFAIPLEQRATLTDGQVIDIAVDVRLDRNAVVACLMDKTPLPPLFEQAIRAEKAGVRGTPSWFLREGEDELIPIGQRGPVLKDVDAILAGADPRTLDQSLSGSLERAYASAEAATREKAEPQPRLAQIAVVARTDLPASHRITADDVRKIRISPSFWLDEMLREVRVGQKTTARIYAGEPIRKEQLTEPKGKRILGLEAPPIPAYPTAERKDMLLVASQPLPAGHVITESDLFLVEVPATTGPAWLGCKPGTCFRNYEEVVGRTVAEDILDNAAIRREKLK